MTRLENALLLHHEFKEDQILWHFCPKYLLGKGFPDCDESTRVWDNVDFSEIIGCRGIYCDDCWNAEVSEDAVVRNFYIGDIVQIDAELFNWRHHNEPSKCIDPAQCKKNWKVVYVLDSTFDNCVLVDETNKMCVVADADDLKLVVRNKK